MKRSILNTNNESIKTLFYSATHKSKILEQKNLPFNIPKFLALLRTPRLNICYTFGNGFSQNSKTIFRDQHIILNANAAETICFFHFIIIDEF